jgi:hypothetical protein
MVVSAPKESETDEEITKRNLVLKNVDLTRFAAFMHWEQEDPSPWFGKIVDTRSIGKGANADTRLEVHWYQKDIDTGELWPCFIDPANKKSWTIGGDEKHSTRYTTLVTTDTVVMWNLNAVVGNPRLLQKDDEKEAVAAFRKNRKGSSNKKPKGKRSKRVRKAVDHGVMVSSQMEIDE